MDADGTRSLLHGNYLVVDQTRVSEPSCHEGEQLTLDLLDRSQRLGGHELQILGLDVRRSKFSAARGDGGTRIALAGRDRASDRLQRPMQPGRAGALIGGQVNVAAGQGQPVGLADGGANLDPDGHIQIADETLDHHRLLSVLLAEVRDVGRQVLNSSSAPGNRFFFLRISCFCCFLICLCLAQYRIATRRIIFLDFGLVGELRADQRLTLIQLLFALKSTDSGGIADALIALGETGPGWDGTGSATTSTGSSAST